MIDLSKKYEDKKFKFFLQNFLPTDFISLDDELKLDPDHNYFKSAQLLGTVKSLNDLVVIEVERLKSEKSRIKITRELFKLLEEFGYSNALVITYSKKEDHYRLSFIKSELVWVTDSKVKKKFTNPVRYSFLLGKNAKIHTPFAQLIKLGRVKDFDDLFRRFNIEVVGDEFFSSYKSLYLRLKEYLEKDKIFSKFSKIKDIGIDFFAKKLLGQIVFCYFLQKKGWLGVEKNKNWGTGDQNYLRNQFNLYEKSKKNFFNHFLEFFFYDGLNKQNQNDFLKKFNCKVPYIGGELFYYYDGYDWENENLNIPNNLFSNKDNNGILDIFDLYNFTIDELASLDIEIAIDPEMLGKVFERLLDIKDRKSKGAFYTPRKIVSYMSKNSIIEFLYKSLGSKLISKKDIKNFILYNTDDENFPEQKIFMIREEIDKHLSSVKILDPAIGSGAFPVEILNLICELRYKLNKFLGSSRNKYELKKHAIENSIYGVDIDKGAIEIAKLRLWLSLIIDKRDKEQISPLPNLDFKIIKGDSLDKIKIDVFVYEKLLETEKLKTEYLFTTKKNRQKDLKLKIQNNLNQFKKDNSFDIRVYFSEVFNSKGGFDIIIGNPPYINFANLTSEQRKKYSSFSVLKNKTDIYAFFIESSSMWASDNSTIIFIITNTWKATDSFLLLRKFMLNNFEISKIINLKEGTFDASNVPLIIFLKKSKRNNYNIEIFDHKFNYFKKLNSDKLLSNPTHQFNTTCSINEDLLLEKISSKGQKLYNYLRFSRGIKTSNDKKFIVKNKADKDHKKVFRGKNISQYNIEWDGEFINYKPYLMKKKSGSVPYTKEFFEVDKKIVLQRIAQNLPVSIDYDKRYFLDTAIVSDFKTIKQNLSLEYICALLNSKLIKFWYNNTFQLATVGIYELHNIPVIYPDKNKELITKVEKSVFQIFDNIKNNSSKIESTLKKLDDIFYKIYELNENEIKIILEYTDNR